MFATSNLSLQQDENNLQQRKQENPALPNISQREKNSICSQEPNGRTPMSNNFTAPEYINFTNGNSSSYLSPYGTHPQINNEFPLDSATNLPQNLPTSPVGILPQRPITVPRNTLATNRNSIIDSAWKMTERSAQKPKRVRIAFTTYQLEVLSREYKISRFVGRSRRLELSHLLHIPEKNIKIWFQNERMRRKNDLKEAAKKKAEATSTMQSEPGLFISQQQNQAYHNGVSVFSQEHPGPSTSAPSTSLGYYAGYALAEADSYSYQHNITSIPTQQYSLQYNVDQDSPDSTLYSESYVSEETGDLPDTTDKQYDMSFIRMSL